MNTERDTIEIGVSTEGAPLRLGLSEMVQHKGVSGPTGSGKTSFLWAPIAHVRLRVPVICLDASDEHARTDGANVLDPAWVGIPFDLRSIPTDPFTLAPMPLADRARVLTELIRELRPQIGPGQLALLGDIVTDVLRRGPDLHDVPQLLRAASWAEPSMCRSLLAQLDPVLGDPGLRSTAKASARSLVDGTPALHAARIRSTLPASEVARVVFSLHGLFQACLELPPEHRQRTLLVIEELRRFRHPLILALIDRILREGRRAGLFVCLSDQTPLSESLATNLGIDVAMLPGGEHGQALVSMYKTREVRALCVQHAPTRRAPTLRLAAGPVRRFLNNIS